MKNKLQKTLLRSLFAMALLMSTGAWSQAYYNLQWPENGEIMETQSHNVYAQAWEPGVTSIPGAAAGLEVWIGVSPEGQNTNPNTWTMWIPATYQGQSGENDEYTASIGADLAPGTYYYASRFRYNGGGFGYGGFNSGAWDGGDNPSGVLIVTSNPACTTTWYLDNDKDGHGTNAGTMIACNQPEGYASNNTDCDDTNASIYYSADLFIDSDGDGYTNGNGNDICYGNPLPDGYAISSLGQDCDDNDETVWQLLDVFVDQDGDQYGNGVVTDMCVGAEAPEGYVIISLGPDCNDDDETAWRISDLFVDGDGDGYGTSVVEDVCFGEVPEGYSLTSLGNDCDDSDGEVWQMADVFIDSDSDGYNNGFIVGHCYGAVLTEGYSFTTEGADCDDENPGINPGAHEISANGIDENCNGMADDGAGEFFTQIRSNQCGGTLPRIYSSILADTNTENVTQYYFEVTDPDGNIQTLISPNFWAQLIHLDEYEYGTTYTVRVGMDVNDVWQGYGPACTITTPSLFEGPYALNIPQCGTTLAERFHPINIAGPNMISSYEINVTNMSTGVDATITRTTPWFNLKMLPAIYDYDTTYSITCRVATTGDYSEWTTPCEVTTPAAAAGFAANNGPAIAAMKAVAYPNPFVDGFNVNLEATGEAPVQVQVYDLVGKLLESREIAPAELQSQRLGSNFTSGVYNVIITQGDSIESIRVIKR